MKFATKKDMVQFVWDKLKEQGMQSQLDYACKYRGPCGTKCAAGWLIEDEFYCRELEGQVVERNNHIYNALLKSGIDESFIPLVREMQKIHDRFDVDSWDEEFQNLLDSVDPFYQEGV